MVVVVDMVDRAAAVSEVFLKLRFNNLCMTSKVVDVASGVEFASRVCFRFERLLSEFFQRRHVTVLGKVVATRFY